MLLSWFVLSRRFARIFLLRDNELEPGVTRYRYTGSPTKFLSSFRRLIINAAVIAAGCAYAYDTKLSVSHDFAPPPPGQHSKHGRHACLIFRRRISLLRSGTKLQHCAPDDHE